MNENAFENFKKARRADCLKYKEFDEKYSVDTWHPTRISMDGTGEEAPGGIDNSFKYPGSVGYSNTALSQLDDINEYLSKIINIPDYNFIDIGSGKGRTLIYNNEINSGYKKYIGVEIDEYLHNTAVSNLQNKANVELFNVSLIDYTVPEELSVIFTFGSGGKEKWEEFLSKNNFISGTIIVSVLGYPAFDEKTKVQFEYPETKFGFSLIHAQDLIYFYKKD